MSMIKIYTTSTCGYCRRAKFLLDQKQVVYQEISVDNNPELRQAMMEKTGCRTVPMILINQQFIGGCSELYALESSGELDALLTDTKKEKEIEYV